MKTVLIYSGGMDSSVLLYDLVSSSHEVKAISFDYGQRHRKELEYASYNTRKLGVDHRVIDLSSLLPLFGKSSLTNSGVEIPEGHYTEDSMKSTVVPNRNLILISIAAAWAMSERFDSVSYGAHAGDHTIYPDCREEFATAVGEVLALADWHPIALKRPYVNMTKGDICRRGADLGVDFSMTWSCYKGGDNHCGVCGTCVERREAFREGDVADPTLYGA